MGRKQENISTSQIKKMERIISIALQGYVTNVNNVERYDLKGGAVRKLSDIKARSSCCSKCYYGALLHNF